MTNINRTRKILSEFFDPVSLTIGGGLAAAAATAAGIYGKKNAKLIDARTAEADAGGIPTTKKANIFGKVAHAVGDLAPRIERHLLQGQVDRYRTTAAEFHNRIAAAYNIKPDHYVKLLTQHANWEKIGKPKAEHVNHQVNRLLDAGIGHDELTKFHYADLKNIADYVQAQKDSGNDKLKTAEDIMASNPGLVTTTVDDKDRFQNHLEFLETHGESPLSALDKISPEGRKLRQKFASFLQQGERLPQFDAKLNTLSDTIQKRVNARREHSSLFGR